MNVIESRNGSLAGFIDALCTFCQHGASVCLMHLTSPHASHSALASSSNEDLV